MKSKWMLLGSLACALAIPAVAQDAPKVEVTGEYSYFRFNPSLPRLQNRNFNGGGFDASFFLRPALGIKADLMFYGGTTFTTTFGTVITRQGTIPAGTYSAHGTLKNYLFQPIWQGRLKRFGPF